MTDAETRQRKDQNHTHETADTHIRKFAFTGFYCIKLYSLICHGICVTERFRHLNTGFVTCTNTYISHIISQYVTKAALNLLILAQLCRIYSC